MDWLRGGKPQSPAPNTQHESDADEQAPRLPERPSATTRTLENGPDEKGDFHTKTLQTFAGMSQPLFPGLASKLRDGKKARLGKDDLCEQCLRFPIAEFQLSESQSGKTQWMTPLDRLLQQPWCTLCRLLLHMLSRPQNDPLKNEKVAQHVPDAIKGWTLSQFAEQDWPSIEKQWPFGRSAKREKNPTHAPEDDADVADDGALKIFTIPAENGVHNTATEGKAKPPQLRYRKECYIVVTPHSSKNTEHSSGHLTVKCWGCTGDPQSERIVLGKFHLRVAEDQAYTFPSLGTVSYGRKVDPEWIELQTAGQWLSECVEKHGDSCHKHKWEAAREAPKYIRVIDVQERCIATFNSPSIPYVALSYMWGGVEGLLLTRGNMEALQKPGGLTSLTHEIPRTIVNAMEVVKGMGQRYLWVDALCKLQDEMDPEAELETRQMDRVYGGALLTLVAASGEDANSGIAGVRNNTMAPGNEKVPRKLRQESTEVRGAHVIAPLDNQNNLETTRWNERGWTFQERLLSRRLLVFAHDEMVWYCRGMTCREDMDHGRVEGATHPPRFLNLNAEWFDGNPADSKRPSVEGWSDAPTKAEKRRWADGSLETDRFGTTYLVRSRRLSEYVHAVEKYTSREITDKADIERAFLGLGAVFERSFKTRLAYGLLEGVLDVTLLWRPKGPMKRRTCTLHFPSWSWTGWEGAAVKYGLPFRMDRDRDGTIQGYETATLGEEGIRPLLRYHTWASERRRWTPANFTGWGFPHPKKGFPEGWQRFFPEGQEEAFFKSHPATRPVPEGFVDQNLLEPYHITFSTKTVKTFQLGQPTDNVGLYKVDPSCPTEPRPLEILDDRGHSIGALTLDESGTPPANLSRYELVVLAEAHGLKKSQYPNQAAKVEEFKDYLVMLVVLTRRGNIYERRGLGQVEKTYFDGGNAEIKTIILG